MTKHIIFWTLEYLCNTPVFTNCLLFHAWESQKQIVLRAFICCSLKSGSAFFLWQSNAAFAGQQMEGYSVCARHQMSITLFRNLNWYQNSFRHNLCIAIYCSSNRADQILETKNHVLKPSLVLDHCFFLCFKMVFCFEKWLYDQGKQKTKLISKINIHWWSNYPINLCLVFLVIQG